MSWEDLTLGWLIFWMFELRAFVGGGPRPSDWGIISFQLFRIIPRELLNFSSLEGNSTVKSRTGNEFSDIGISIKFRENWIQLSGIRAHYAIICYGHREQTLSPEERRVSKRWPRTRPHGERGICYLVSSSNYFNWPFQDRGTVVAYFAATVPRSL